ncbi:acetate--CoA ligase family protein [Rhodococcus sp. IEGM 1366]|uniref:acetate--CoA ligase family protein n=1 Tax=Rhodococcus sp. IEGM 1366 TaxID=3082223 RepID=UPI002954E398|nr:acetate--CoA ligase family protein [Rhodococcus sp. IEGM 1366]MDV8070579.1 acetate--CoA ligase family protein [Rhodococcus sp. IEGM 1366]
MTIDHLTAPAVRDLSHAILAPSSIALVGASDDPGKTTGRPLRFLRASGYAGRIYPVNPRRDIVQGEKAWPSLTDLPEVPEHVFIMTGSDTAVAAVEECGRLGVTVATVLASGFSESGPAGAERERRLIETARTCGVRLIGPSSLGVANPNNGLVLTANAAFAEKDLPGGSTFVASQSGSMIGALASRGKARGIGFAGLVSTGGECDLSVGELCTATLDDPAVTSYLLFLENLRGADELRDFARGAAERGKPVTVYKLGRSDAAAELAVSHTGALAGADDVAAEFFADNAIARVDTVEGLLECAALAARLPIRPAGSPPPRVGVVTTTGGGAAMVVDQLGVRGIDVQRASDETFAELARRGVDASPARIVDVTLAGTKYEVMSQALDVLLSSGEFDLLIAVIGSSARFNPELALRALIDSKDAPTPLAAFIVPDAPDALTLLADKNIPAFRTPEACADVVAATFRRRTPHTTPPLAARPDENSPSRILDEVEAYGFLDTLSIPHAPALVLDVLEDPVIDTLPFPYPVVAKVLDSRIAHKSDVGGVVLHIANEQQLRDAVARIVQSVAEHRPDVQVQRILVQPMVSGLGEVLVGYRVDPDAGPIVMLAAGGELAEIHRDRSIRTAPASREAAVEMTEEVAALELYRGFRGRDHGDVDAIVDTIVALSSIAERPGPAVFEAEVNPLLINKTGHGVCAVDALVRIAIAEGQEHA